LKRPAEAGRFPKLRLILILTALLATLTGLTTLPWFLRLLAGLVLLTLLAALSRFVALLILLILIVLVRHRRFPSNDYKEKLNQRPRILFRPRTTSSLQNARTSHAGRLFSLRAGLTSVRLCALRLAHHRRRLRTIELHHPVVVADQIN
jgi:type IV secretory pathway TrbD component